MDTPTHSLMENQGPYIHPHLLRLNRDGMITSTELKVTAIVCKISTFGEGCWASYSTLAFESGVSKRHIVRCVTKLKRIGVLYEDGHLLKHGQIHRVLRPWYMRPPHPTSSMTGVDTGVNGGSDTGVPQYKYIKKTNNKANLPIGSVRLREGGYKVFFPQEKKGPKVPGKEARDLSDLHRGYCKKRGWPVAPRPTLWAKQFQILINRYGYEEVKSLLTWYHNNHPDKMWLPLKNGERFKKKIDVVMDLMEKDKLDNPKIGKKAKALALALTEEFKWPKGSEEKVPAFVQSVLTTYKDFLLRFETLLAKCQLEDQTIDEDVRSIVVYLEDVLPDPESFAGDWARETHSQVYKWDKWSGDLTAFVFRPTHKRFKRMLREWVREYDSEGVSDCKTILDLMGY